MSTDHPTHLRAWEPFTPAGVAAFAQARVWRVLLVQFLMALLVAGVAGWFLREEWFPIIDAAVTRLPAQGEIRGGLLNWPAENAVKLAGNHFLELAVDPVHSGQSAGDAQLRVEFGHKDIWLITLTGDAVVNYPAQRLPFNQTELVPWWGAWEPAVLGIIIGGVFLGVLLSWLVLSTIYCVPVKLITLYENRDLTLGASWRLAGAALMPGALFLTVGILFYEFSSLALVQLGIIWCLHVVIGWIYLFISPMFLPRHSGAAPGGNPFSKAKST